MGKAKGSSPAKTPDSIGTQSGTINVELSTRFLEHFSEQLYSSPQKAFEELISNGWDAGADYVDIRIADDLSQTGATLAVLDNGCSMDEVGLKELWYIAASPKENISILHGRPVIGKFGIGKLATYVLANKLTYICKAADGVIRRVTMDYTRADMQSGTDKDHLIRDLKMEIYTTTEEDVFNALESVSDGKVIADLIRNDVARPDDPDFEDEFGGGESKFERPPKGTWTLVILSDLKPTGRALKLGILRRMLAAALPIGSELAIGVNGTLLASSKIATPVSEDWVIGPDLNIEEFEYDDNGDDSSTPSTSDDTTTSKAQKPSIKVKAKSNPYPCVDIPGIGEVTGRVTLYKTRISKGKSEERGASNGFHVNVRGRVVNQNDPSFGEDNLSHGAWACFRMAVRADGLNEYLTTNREQFKDQKPLRVFRAFLRKVFNKIRGAYDSDASASLPDGGDVLVQSLGVLSLNPLRSVVSETLDGHKSVPGLFDDTGVKDKKDKKKSWENDTADNIKTALNEVKFDRLESDETMVTFRLADNSIVVNKNHPFVEEHSRTKAEKELLRTIAMVNLLSDVYAIDINVPLSKLRSIREYRDKLLRFRAIQRRQSGTYIARLLLQTQHDSEHSKRMEVVLSDALRYLGFNVQDLAKSGEPEGIARAFPTPTTAKPSDEDPEPPLYSFSFDAKSSKHEAAKTGNIKLDGVTEHRRKFKANYALVVAPGYQVGAIVTRCKDLKVTPMVAQDLGRLLEYTVEHGAIPVTKLRELFSLYDPSEVTEWVDQLDEWLTSQRSLTLDIFLKGLERLKGQIPDVLPAATLALECRRELKATKVTAEDVVALARGLSILVPDLVGIDDVDRIVVNASAERVAAAVRGQLEKLHSDVDVNSGTSGDNTT